MGSVRSRSARFRRSHHRRLRFRTRAESLPVRGSSTFGREARAPGRATADRVSWEPRDEDRSSSSPLDALGRTGHAFTPRDVQPHRRRDAMQRLGYELEDATAAYPGRRAPVSRSLPAPRRAASSVSCTSSKLVPDSLFRSSMRFCKVPGSFSKISTMSGVMSFSLTSRRHFRTAAHPGGPSSPPAMTAPSSCRADLRGRDRCRPARCACGNRAGSAYRCSPPLGALDGDLVAVHEVDVGRSRPR